MFIILYPFKTILFPVRYLQSEFEDFECWPSDSLLLFYSNKIINPFFKRGTLFFLNLHRGDNFCDFCLFYISGFPLAGQSGDEKTPLCNFYLK